jgi:hypothetical protein
MNIRINKNNNRMVILPVLMSLVSCQSELLGDNAGVTITPTPSIIPTSTIASSLTPTLTALVTPNPTPILNESKVVSMVINSSKKVCTKNEIQALCLDVTMDGAEESENLYDAIQGFEYQWGHSYELDVEVTEMNNPPADGASIRYELVNTVSNIEDKKWSDYYRYEQLELSENTFKKEGDNYYFLDQNFTCGGFADCKKLLTQEKGSIDVVFEYAGDSSITLENWIETQNYEQLVNDNYTAWIDSNIDSYVFTYTKTGFSIDSGDEWEIQVENGDVISVTNVYTNGLSEGFAIETAPTIDDVYRDILGSCFMIEPSCYVNVVGFDDVYYVPIAFAYTEYSEGYGFDISDFKPL